MHSSLESSDVGEPGAVRGSGTWARAGAGAERVRLWNPRCTVFLLGFALLRIAIPGSVSAKDDRPPINSVAHAPTQPHSGEPVRVTARISSTISNVVLAYQRVDPGNYIDLQDGAYKTKWIPVPMNDRGLDGDAVAGDGVYTATLPGSLQSHRRLVRYRITGTDGSGKTLNAPDLDDGGLNFAYFTYDGVPGWSGAIDPKSKDAKRREIVHFSTDVMRRIQVYHLISKAASVENVTWREQDGGKDYKYTGTFVSGDKVYDHVRFRARGGVWRYAMGKNMWKFDFNKGHFFEAQDDFGRAYHTKWNKVNLRACIQQGDYGHRGEQGMFEAVGFRLFNLAGVEAPDTHWVQLRIIDGVEENPSDQYRGDFWGLYLAIENEDGHFLKEHGLPDGNLYKMENGSGTLRNQGAGAVTNRSDLDRFMAAYQHGTPSQAWWQTNVDLSRYYSYRSILECIHHYDVAEGKNYNYYLNPQTGRWIVFPWDIDLTWADNMYGSGEEPFKRRVLRPSHFRHEYQNRLREIRDLLFNTDQAWQLIDECAAIIAAPSGAPSIVDADRAKWDYHPVMAHGWKAGQGLFYQAARTRDFAGMVRLMKTYVKLRGAWIDATLLNDAKAPPTPVITNIGPESRLAFRSAPYAGTNGFAAIRWRVGEISRPVASDAKPSGPGTYEMIAVWESGELPGFEDEMKIPSEVVKPGHMYRVRARMKEITGLWSHWSAPIEFVGGN